MHKSVIFNIIRLHICELFGAKTIYTRQKIDFLSNCSILPQILPPLLLPSYVSMPHRSVIHLKKLSVKITCYFLDDI